MAKIIRIAAFLLLAAVIIYLIPAAAGRAGETNSAELMKNAEKAVVRAVVSCYALEGKYPESLEYLESSYALVLNTDKYVYHYMPQGSNIMPEIAVFAK